MANQQQKIEESIMLKGREARTVGGILAYLKEKTGRDYKRDSVYRWYRNGEIEAINTPVANYYFLDSLDIESIKNRNKPEGKPKQTGKRIPKEGYSPDIKSRALSLLEDGRSRRSVAEELGVSPQTVNNWANQK